MPLLLRLFLISFVSLLPAATASAAVTLDKYLLAFLACNTQAYDCNNPANHVTYLAQSSDGTGWTTVPGYTPAPGSVPDVVRRGNKLYVYTPGKVRRLDLDTGVWGSPVPVAIATTNGSRELFVDPSPTIDENGSIVLFYLLGQIGSDPATCGGLSSCTKVIHSATEVSGSDGASFTVDGGDRASIAISGNQTASDPDIFVGPNGYVLYISRGQGVQVLTSATLRGSYGNVPGLPGSMLTNNAGGIPAGHYDSASGKYWTYVASNQNGGIQVIRQAIHDRIDVPLTNSAFVTILSGSSFPGLGAGYLVGSPGFAVNIPPASQCILCDCLFNWAERNYPSLFAPAGAASSTLAPFYYRYYLQTNAYLGTSSADSHVYYLGPLSGNSILDVGALSPWLSTAGCQ